MFTIEGSISLQNDFSKLFVILNRVCVLLTTSYELKLVYKQVNHRILMETLSLLLTNVAKIRGKFAEVAVQVVHFNAHSAPKVL